MRKYNLLYWVPRILSILYIIFISLFALDVFGKNFSWSAFFMHLLPTFLFAAVTWVSWKRRFLGGLIFIGLGIFYIMLAWGKASFIAFLLISGPLFVIGSFFILQTRLILKSMVKEILLAMLILFLLYMDGAALNDILKQEPNLTLEYTALALSFVIFGGMILFEIRK